MSSTSQPAYPASRAHLATVGARSARAGRHAAAVELAAALHRLAPPVYGVDAERLAAGLSTAEGHLGPTRYASAWQAGTTRTVDEAAVVALAELAHPPG